MQIRIHKLLFVFLLFSSIPVAAQQLMQNDTGIFVTTPQEYAIPAKGAISVRVVAPDWLSGEISVIAVNEPKCALVLTKQAKVDGRDLAARYTDHITTLFTPKGNSIECTLSGNKPFPWGNAEAPLYIIAELTVPKNCELTVDAPLFSLSAEGPLTSLVNTTSASKLDVLDVNGRLDLRSNGHDIYVERVTGNISVANRKGNLRLFDINATKEAASFRNDSGNTILEKMRGAVSIKNGQGKVEITDFDPAVTERSYINNSDGPISIEIVNLKSGDIVVSNRNDDIELRVPKGISAMLSLSVDPASRIEVTNLRITPELVLPNRLSLRLGEGKSLISGSTAGKGNLFVRGIEGDDN